MGTLHPQLIGFAAMWLPERGACVEVRVKAHMQETDFYRKSPLRAAIEEGKPLRLRAQDVGANDSPIVEVLAAPGFSDYWIVPLPHTERFFNVISVSTRAPGGFSDRDIETMTALFPLLALNLEIVALRHIAENVLAAYVGVRSGQRVLAGEIKRGAGEMIDAIVWVSDMRGYTKLSDRLPEAAMLRLLDAYFSRLVQAVQRNGGEVLKFIGDGMLAIFPIGTGVSAGDAAARALTAAKEGLAAVLALNGPEGDALEIDTPWRPVDMGIALHRGAIFYGNIGADDRLDFTATGPAVNLAARVEPLAKETGRRLLMTGAVAELLSEPLDPLGDFTFRGVAEPVAVFSPPQER